MELLVTLFGVSLLPWTLPIVREGRLLALGTAVLLAGALFGPAFYAVEAGVQWSIDRLLLLGLLGLIVVRWRFGEVSLRPLSRVDWLLVGLAGWLLLRALPAEAIMGGTPPTSRWLAFVAMPMALYSVARIVPVNDRDVGRFLDVMIGLSVYLAVTALLEVSGLHAFVFPRYIVDPAEWEFFGRGRGPFLNPVGNGIVLTAALAAAVCRLVQSGRCGKLGFGVVILLLTAGIVATLTRSVWVGAVLAVAISGLVFLPRSVQLLAVAAAVLGTVALASGLKDELLHLSRDKDLSASDAAKSVELRPLLAIVAWEMFQDRPLTGHGYGGYLVSARPYHTIRDYRLPLETVRPYIQHNLFLSILVEAGLVALAALLLGGVIVAVLAGRLVERRSHSGADVAWAHSGADVAWAHSGADVALALFMLGFLAAYVTNGMFHDVTVIPMMNAFLLFTAGIVITRASEQRRMPSRSSDFAGR